MAKKKKGEENDEEDLDNTEEEKAEKERVEAEYKAKLDEQQKMLSQATEGKVRAEAMLETYQKVIQGQTAPPKEWDAEQWKDFEEKHGMSKEQLTLVDNLVGNRLNEINKSVDERLKASDERARLAEARVGEFEKRSTFATFKSDYFKGKPAYSRYEKEFDEFLKDYPEETKKDPVKLASIFSKAEIYVKGKVGEKTMKRDNSGSLRFDRGSEDVETEAAEYDMSDLRDHEKLTIGRILPSKENEELLKKYKHDLKGDAGIMISGKDEWDAAKK